MLANSENNNCVKWETRREKCKLIVIKILLAISDNSASENFRFYYQQVQ